MRRALDLYRGAGGATCGLKRTGFTRVVGIDIKRQRRYCGDVFVQMDALEYLKTADLSQYDLIWASPPRQFATSLRSAPGKTENVETALPWLIDPATLCGSVQFRVRPLSRRLAA
jgi:hypothetical protein